jgi:hypothetical protein
MAIIAVMPTRSMMSIGSSRKIALSFSRMSIRKTECSFRKLI